MRWWLFALAAGSGAGCGKVENPTADAPKVADAPDLGTLRQGCVVMLHMDEPQWSGAPGEVLDDCGGDDRGTLMGTASTVPNGVRGRAGSFAGTGCIQIADSPALRAAGSLTMSAWVLPTAQDGDLAYGVISKRLDMASMSAYSLYLWVGFHAWVDLEGMDDRFEGNTAIANNAWTQLTVIYDGARPAAQRARIYINGSFDVSAPETATTLSAFTAPLSVGCLPSASGNQNFIGQLDEVAVWNRALSDPEITQWYTATRP
jgi:MSHA biogenesis protein MshQ